MKKNSCKFSSRAVSLLACCWLLFSVLVAQSPQLSLAEQYYAQMNLDQAFQAYQDLWESSSTSAEERATAGRMLAKWYWLFLQDETKAIRILEELNSMPHSAKLYLVWARLHGLSGQFNQGLTLLENASQDTSSHKEMLESLRHSLVLEKNLSSWDTKGTFNREEVEKSVENLRALDRTGSLSKVDKKILLGLGLLVGATDVILQSWLDYHDIEQIELASSILRSAYERLEQACANDLRQAEDWHSLIEGLTISGFVHWAAIVAKGKLKPPFSTAIGNLLTLDGGYPEIEHVTLQHYRASVRGEAKPRLYRKKIHQILRSMASQFSWYSPTAKFSLDDFLAELDRRYHTVFRLYTSRFTGLHLGQAIADTVLLVNQYDQIAKVRYVRVDHMVSNGFGTWFWDGKLSHSGWINKGKAVFQVQLATLEERAWDKIKDKEAEDNWLDRIADRRVMDKTLIKKNPYAYLPGLHAKIRHQSVSRIRNQIPITWSNKAQKREFIRQFREKMQLGTVLHEGRHAIDKSLKKKWRDDEFEFRAKLSEVVFHPDPFFALAYGGILSPDIGGKGAHSQANLKIFTCLAEWMSLHQQEISNYKVEYPPLFQLNLLTGEQLRSAFRSLDPLEKRSK